MYPKTIIPNFIGTILMLSGNIRRYARCILGICSYKKLQDSATTENTK